MRAGFALVALCLLVASFGAACTTAPTPRPSEGPSKFLSGFSLPAVAASINSTPNGPRCLNVAPNLPMTHEPRDDAFGGWSIATLTTTCDDPGDGTALGQAWAAGITAELNRLAASVVALGEGTTESGEKVTTDWEYISSGLHGQISVAVLPAPDGHFWTIVRIFEPS